MLVIKGTLELSFSVGWIDNGLPKSSEGELDDLLMERAVAVMFQVQIILTSTLSNSARISSFYAHHIPRGHVLECPVVLFLALVERQSDYFVVSAV